MADEKVLNTEPAASQQYDDAAEQAQYLENRAKRIAED